MSVCLHAEFRAFSSLGPDCVRLLHATKQSQVRVAERTNERTERTLQTSLLLLLFLFHGCWIHSFSRPSLLLFSSPYALPHSFILFQLLSSSSSHIHYTHSHTHELTSAKKTLPAKYDEVFEVFAHEQYQSNTLILYFTFSMHITSYIVYAAKNISYNTLVHTSETRIKTPYGDML